MRKVIVLIYSATLILGMVGTAGASPFTDTKYLGKWLSGTGHYTWEHDTPHDFGGPNCIVISENPGIPAGLVSDVNTNIIFSGKASGSLNKGSRWTSLDGWTGVGIEDVLVNWNAGDPFKISPANNNMKSSKLFSSIFILNFSTSSVPTPEPANLLMLGFGLIGVSFLGRKKFTPKTHRT
jgi:hypothetical protein